MNTRASSIEDASTPEEFIAALRRQSDKCFADALELSGAWQDRNAGKFWTVAARELDKLADKLARVSP